ncbi:MAG: hypothetical protein IJ217_04840 [Clostridia bacterium]|nr:hypothetical protein [Clostridia bacterium]
MRITSVTGLSRKEIYSVAAEYAGTDEMLAERYFMRRYDMTSWVYRNILRKAVVESVVPDDIVERMAQKAQSNSAVNGGSGGAVRSKIYYGNLKLKRETFEFPKGERLSYVRIYLNSDDTLEEVGRRYYIQSNLLQRTFQSAITDSLISDEELKRLEVRFIEDPSPLAKVFQEHFDSMVNVRKMNAKAKARKEKKAELPKPEMPKKAKPVKNSTPASVGEQLSLFAEHGWNGEIKKEFLNDGQ